MNEKIIHLETIEPLELYGTNNQNIDQIKSYFPQLKIIARGDNLKVVGPEEDIEYFIKKIYLMVSYIHQYGNITSEEISRIMDEDISNLPRNKESESDLILYGKNGIPIQAKTPNQRKLVNSANQNDLIIAVGPAGTGKTYTAVALAVKALKNREIKRIILTRPAVEAGENLGFLPGDLKDKLDPYLQPLYDALNDMLPASKLKIYMEEGTIQIAPLAFMRGRTLDNAYVILDEGQNASENQIKMFLTRMGKNAKFIVTGDLTQIDLPHHQRSGLKQAVKILNNIDGIDIIYLDDRDIIRHKLVTKIVQAYKNEKENPDFLNS